MCDTTISPFLPIAIIATGKALPAIKLTSTELDARFKKPAGWAQKHSGIEYRHHARADERQSTLAAQALRDALDRGNVNPDSIDLLLSASGVQEQALPCTAALVLGQAGLRPGTPGFDINATCLGFLAALRVAASLLNTSSYRRIAIVASDLASRGIDWDDTESSLIFGDGAAAAIVERGDGARGIEGYRLNTWPEGATYCEIRAGGTRRTPRTGAEPSDFLFHMEGRRVLRLGTVATDDLLAGLFKETGLSFNDMDVVVPHQPSPLGMRYLAERVPDDRIVNIYATHGNQVAASIPTALHEAFVTGRAQPGRRLMLIGTAGGISVGALILKL
ncbi:MAG: hypothetical protein LBV44_04660 [Methylobacillus sp.]|jgi:3-oxoacyl-[acyl-carrier-protein] synthase-3|nr:hypothetical protein [Methylobacillus sp.]